MAEPTQPLERCPECGGRVVVTTGAGHAVPYAGVMVPLPEALPIEYCEGCGAIAAGELASLRETAYLLRAPANAKRLLAGLAAAYAGTTEPQPVADLRRDLGLGEE